MSMFKYECNVVGKLSECRLQVPIRIYDSMYQMNTSINALFLILHVEFPEKP